MFPLGLAPLPVSRLDGDAPLPESAAWGDFVTDDAIRQVNSGPCYERMPVPMEELGLSSCEDDFAGRSLRAVPYSSPARLFVPVAWPATAVREVSFRENRKGRATPPSLPLWDSRDAGAASRSGYRWWVPGLIGVAATFLLSAVLLVSSQESAVLGTASDVAHPERAQFFEPRLDLPLETPAQNADQPAVASTEFSFPR